MIPFDFFILEFMLYTWKNEPAENFPVKILYYSFEDSAWVTVFGGTVKTGNLRLTEQVRDATPAQEKFYSLITAGSLPPIRVCPQDILNEDLTKTPVITSTFTFNQLSVDGQEAFQIDFGKSYMIQDILMVDSNSTFDEIIPVANYFPITVTTTEPETPPIPIQDLYTNLVSEIVSGNNNNADSPYKLSNISVKLKALIHEEGGSMSASLLNLENSENVNGDAISELVFDITPVSNREENNIAVPNLLGLTETAVRRILKSLGLKLNPVYQKKDTVVNGDSFKQSPTPGTNVPPNRIVNVIFSKHE